MASDARQISESALVQEGIDPEDVDLQWRDGTVWKPYSVLESLSPVRLRVRWMLKTPNHVWHEYEKMEGLGAVAQGKLREHWRNRGVERMPDREVSAWPSFLASYAGPKEAGASEEVSFMALTSPETESAAVQVLHPAPVFLHDSVCARACPRTRDAWIWLQLFV